MAKTLTPERLGQRQANFQKASQLFEQFGGKIINGFPVIDASVYYTANSTPYLKQCGVALIGKPQVELGTIEGFLKGYSEKLGFAGYLKDPVKLTDGAQLAKLAGQTCYMSFGPDRTMNKNADDYIEDIKKSGHGSVLEHVNFSFLFYGGSRSESHEHVRHRVGIAISQQSQRYVGEEKLRFIERPEYQEVSELHAEFEDEIGEAAIRYERKTAQLIALQDSGESQILNEEQKTAKRLKVRQVARASLPNETETVMVWTTNARGLQNYLHMRGSKVAETEIRRRAVRIYLCSIMAEPILFSDIELVNLPDGTYGLTSPYPKP